MHKVLAASTAVFISVAGCSSPEVGPTPVVSQEQSASSSSNELVPSSGTSGAVAILSEAILTDILQEKQRALEQSHGAPLQTSLRILKQGESVDCVLVPEIVFPLSWDDPMAAYNCLADKQIVVSEAFITEHLDSKTDPVTTAEILLAHELGHSVMDFYGLDALTADKTMAERQADCLAGSTFAQLPESNKVAAEAFAAYAVVSEDFDGRKQAFAAGLNGSYCDE